MEIPEKWTQEPPCFAITTGVRLRSHTNQLRKRYWRSFVTRYGVFGPRKHFPRYWPFGTGHRWIPLTKASDAHLWYFLWSVHEQTSMQTIETPVIGDAIVLIMTSLYCIAEPRSCQLRSITAQIPILLAPKQNGSTRTLQRIILNKIVWIFSKFSRKFVPKDTIHNKSVLAKEMAYHRERWLTEAMMTWFVNAYMRHQVPMS